MKRKAKAMTTTRHKPIKWLTMREVKAAARQGRAAAIKCVQLHWWQLSHATVADIRRFPRPLNTLIRADYCALCQLYSNREGTCQHCPLYDPERRKRPCCLEWEDTCWAATFWCLASEEKQDRRYKEWQKAAKRMYERTLKCK